ncbi:MAG: phosphocarrier protein HPr [Candidatus Hydrothermota bacterium]|nr:MAG: phosphocarrier protein HPr [Candidatus Hydrothermae bacterium]
MVKKTVKIVNSLGIHARPATLFVQTAEKFQSDITVEKNGMEVDGKSIFGLLMLVAGQGSSITIKAEGPDEEQAVEELAKLVESGFGED